MLTQHLFPSVPVHLQPGIVDMLEPPLLINVKIARLRTLDNFAESLLTLT